ncbi:MAG: YlxM family DNA-binding protein [Bacillota bacterium]|jgi:hypothetical protein|nr:YlxM family DNA-binding protein [Bacillota bacterium]MDD3297487.1 YlxM family DNA-binding protein [Bacillota bacterium]MDD3850160.1 YlxM family DNA-binding protein [Bacillota bacterium]MDD4706883.1 YlxM family DNA-binding protein [Bacillota bacterium]
MDDKFVETALLYDFYGKVLTPRQQEIIDLYYMKDYSLAEIGELLDISRQAVHDNLKRAKKQLSVMEEGLGLVDRFQRDREEWSKVLDRLDGVIDALETERKGKSLTRELRDIREFIRLAMGG